MILKLNIIFHLQNTIFGYSDNASNYKFPNYTASLSLTLPSAYLNAWLPGLLPAPPLCDIQRAF